jgi:hypothetical protein
MPRRKSEWDQLKQGLLGMQELGKTVEEREYIPEKSCGKCKNFFASPGLTAGHCLTLKIGSDIAANPPVFVLDGEVALMSNIRMDASPCQYYEEMELIDTDIGEAFDPRYSRHQRQMMR